MAKFSQTFLQGLLQPSYQQGLFTAAQKAGQLPGQLQQQKAQQQQMQAMASATPEQRFDIAIAQLTKAGKLSEAAKLTAQKAKYVAEQQVRVDDQITSLVANQMFATGASDVPATVTINEREIAIPSYLRSEILEEVNSIQTNKDSREVAMTEGTLSSFSEEYIKNNPYLLENDDVLNAQYNRLTDPNSGMLRTERKNAALALTKAVEADRAAKKTALTGEKALGVQVEALVEDIKTRGSNTPFWKGNDMADFLSDAEDDELDLFKKQAVLKLQQDPSATEAEIINYAMTGMREQIPGETQSRAIRENMRIRAAMFEEIVDDLMKEMGMSREQAEAEARRRTDPSPANINAILGAGLPM